MKQQRINLFSRLLLRQKFIILGLIAFTLVGIAFYSFVDGQREKINVTVREQQGLKPARELLTLVQILPRHRGSSTGLLSGNSAMAAEEQTTKALADQHIAAFDAWAKSINDQELNEIWEGIKQDWPKVAEKVDARSVTPPQNFQAHTQLITKVLEVLDLVVDHYGLSLDPYSESYYLMRAILVDSPILTEYLGQARGWGTGLLAKAAKQAAAKEKDATVPQNVITLQDRSRLALMASIANSHLQNASRDFNKFLKVNQALETKLDEQLSNASVLANKAIQLSETEIFSKTMPNYSSTEYYKQYTQAIDEMYKAIDMGFTELDTIFNKQIASATQKLLIISAIIIGLIMMCALIALYIVNSITRPIDSLVGVIQKLADGDSSVRANLQTFDEIGVLGRQFDMMVDQREAIRDKIQQENDDLNNSIIELLYAVAKLAQKDLTSRAVVAEDVTGPISDALNLLSDETSKVLNRVMQIANEVSEVSQQVQIQSSMVINVAEEEKREVEQATTELNEASSAMLDIARLAFSCNEAAEKAIKNTDKAQQTVLGTVQGITTIRDTIRETEKRIKRLGERSQEIGGVVNLINDIAERTHILALNASMHAASAGEAGRGFAVVANEVQKLAENSREATSKISALVNNIQVETADTVTTMNEAISQVVRGTDLAQQAGNEMRETRETTADLVQLVQRIAASSTSQSETSQRLVARAQQIQKSTDQTYGQLQDQGAQTELLVNLSEMLVASVGVFNLPKVAS
ncbi:MAG: methyl-accepting chemotaxis protein [Methylococcaceae bacterium]